MAQALASYGPAPCRGVRGSLTAPVCFALLLSTDPHLTCSVFLTPSAWVITAVPREQGLCRMFAVTNPPHRQEPGRYTAYGLPERGGREGVWCCGSTGRQASVEARVSGKAPWRRWRASQAGVNPVRRERRGISSRQNTHEGPDSRRRLTRGPERTPTQPQRREQAANRAVGPDGSGPGSLLRTSAWLNRTMDKGSQQSSDRSWIVPKQPF